jgi:hypothetical protein
MSSPASSIATSSQANSPVAVPGMAVASPSTSIGAATPSAPAMSIGSIITPTNLRGFSQPDQNWPDQFHSHFVTQPRSSYPPELVYGPPADDSPFYSSDSCYSPSSETPHTHPYLPPYDKPTLASPSYQTEYDQMTTPLSMMTPEFVGAWNNFEMGPSMEGLGIGFEGQYPNPVGISLSTCVTHEQPVDHLTEPSTPTNLASLEPHGEIGIPAISPYATGLDANRNAMVMADDDALNDYSDCYWKYFHPRFPFIHRPTTTLYDIKSPALGTMILAIGAQFSSRAHSQYHSTIWFALAAKSCAMVRASIRVDCSPLMTFRLTLR